MENLKLYILQKFINQMNLRENNNSENQINVLPMIDIIFAILSLFIISSTFFTRIDSLEVNNPVSSAAVIEKNKPLIITIISNEQIYLKDSLISINILSREVKAIFERLENTSIILRADASVKHEYIIKILDELVIIKNSKIGISTLKN